MLLCQKGVSNVESAASLVAQILRVDDARAGTSEAPRIVPTTVPTFKSPRSPSLNHAGLRQCRTQENPCGRKRAHFHISIPGIAELLEGAHENNDSGTRLPFCRIRVYRLRPLRSGKAQQAAEASLSCGSNWPRQRVRRGRKPTPADHQGAERRWLDHRVHSIRKPS